MEKVEIKIESELYKAVENHYNKYERYYKVAGVNSPEQLLQIWLLELLIKSRQGS